MAGENSTAQGIGYAVDIPEEILTRLDEADKKIEKLGVTAEKTEKRFSEAFKKMSTNLETFSDSLNTASDIMDRLKTGDFVSGMGKIVGSMEAATDSTNKYAESLKKSDRYSENFAASSMNLANALNSMKPEKFNLTSVMDSMKKEISVLNEEMKIYGQYLNVADFNTQKLAEQGITELSRKIKELIVSYDALNKNSKAFRSNNVFSDYIDDLNKTTLEQRRQTDSMKEMSAYYKELEKNSKSFAEANKKAKDSAQEATRAWSDRVGVWEKGFENAAKQEEEAIAKASQADEKAYTDWLRRRDEEVKAQKKAEDEKYRLTLERIRNQNAQYEKEQQQQQKAYNALNEQAKQSAVAATDAFNERVKVWEKGFDEADKREKAARLAAEKEFEASKKRILQISKELEKESKRQEKAIAEQKKLQESKLLQSPTGALQSARVAKTYNERAAALKNLEAAIKNLNTADADYNKNLKHLSDAYKQLQKEQSAVEKQYRTMAKKQRNLINYTDQLTRRLALAFSISQMWGYVTTLTKVRGEFELQNKALAAILQNKDEADKLFNQITELAVKSPFQLKELVTYTKQLAAYRFESEKLFSVTKQLADVSAGLGVGMDRLILSTGQVKASNYLRGTELRQFSEAGINILGELSKYFTELEGRAISVGEVFEMVSKRMVSFADVEEVFNRITGEGGVFYNMQEVQANTLAGMVSNMKDSIDIMLNDIGKMNEGVLKGSVSFVRELVDNWREVAYTFKQVLVVFASYVGVMKLAALGNSQFANTVFITTKRILGMGNAATLSAGKIGLLATVTKTAGAALKGLGAAMLTLIPVLALTAIAELIRLMTKASREAKELEKNISRIFSEDTSALDKQTASYMSLVDQLKKANEGTQERRDIIGKINSNYGEYLGFIVSEQTSYDKLAASVDKVTEAMKRRAMMTTQEKATQELYKSYSDRISTAEDDMRRMLDAQTYTISGKNRKLTEDEIDALIGLVKDKMKELNRAIDASEIKQTINEFFESEVSGYSVANIPFKEYFDVMEEFERKQQDISDRIARLYDNQTFSSKKSLEAFKNLEKERKDALDKAYKDFEGSPTKYRRKVDEIEKEFAIKKIDLQVEFEGLDKETAEKRKMLLDWASDTVKDINKKLEEFGKDYDEGLLEKVLIGKDEAETGLSEVAKSVIQQYEAQMKIIEEENNRRKVGTVYDEKAIQRATQLSKLLYEKGRLLGIENELKDKGGKTDSKELERVRKMIGLIKEAGQAYENMRKYSSEDESTDRIRESFKDAFNAFEMGDIGATMTFDLSGMIDALNQLMKRFGKDAQKEIEKAKAPLEAEQTVRVKAEYLTDSETEIQEMFDSYQLSLDLSKIGIDKDLMSQLFGIDTFSLEDLRNQIFSKQVSFEGTEGEKAYADILKKLADMENAALKERMKKYYEYLLKSKDERIVITEQALKEIEELEKDQNLTSTQKVTVKQKIEQEKDRKIAEVDWKELKETDIFRQSFEDLERVGTTTLTILITKLQEFAKASGRYLDTEDVKEVMNNIKSLRDEIESRDPFGMLVEGIREYQQASANLKASQAQYSEDLTNYEQAQAAYELALQNLQSIPAEEKIAFYEALAMAEMNLAEANRKLQESQGKVVEDESKQADALTKTQKAAKGVSSVMNQLGDAVNSSIDGVQELAEGLGFAFDEETNAVIDAFQQGFSTVITLITAATSAVIALGVAGETTEAILTPLLIIGASVAAIVGTIFAIIAVHDNKRKKIIEDEQKRMKELQEAYEDLEKAFENAWSMEDLIATQEAMEENLKMQIESSKKSIAAMEDMKKKNKQDIEEEKENLAELEKQLDELQKKQQLIIEFGGVGEEGRKDAASEFVDAWMDAFLETGNGLSGLNDQFTEFYQNMVKKQLLMRATQKFLEPFFEEFDKMFEEGSLGDEKVTTEEVENIKNLWDDTSVGLNDFLTELAESLGLVGGVGDKDLSGLSKGIQSITEETAQALEALLNSMRASVFAQENILKNIHSFLMYGDETSNPMLAELKNQTIVMKSINSILSSVVKAGHPKGGNGIKVYID